MITVTLALPVQPPAYERWTPAEYQRAYIRVHEEFRVFARMVEIAEFVRAKFSTDKHNPEIDDLRRALFEAYIKKARDDLAEAMNETYLPFLSTICDHNTHELITAVSNYLERYMYGAPSHKCLKEIATSDRDINSLTWSDVYQETASR